MNSGYLLFFENTIMGNTADLALVQKTIINTLHKEGKSQRVITERGGCSRSAVSSILNAKLTGRKRLGRKSAQATGMTASLRIWSSKADSNTLESFTRSELKLEWVQHRQKHLTWAKEKKNWTVAQWSKILFSDESKFCPRVWWKSGEAQNPCCLKSSGKFP